MNQRDLLLIGGGVIAGLALGVAFPQARRKLAPFISETGERAGGILSGLAELVASQLEKVEDFTAEQKSKGAESA
jgi:hypothetical protein